MKVFYLVPALWVFLAASSLAQTANDPSPESQYLAIWDMVSKADRSNDAGAFASAIADDKSAQTALKKLQTDFPRWNTNTVALLLDYVNGKLTGLASKAPEVAATPASAPPTTNPTTAQLTPEAAPAAGDLTNQLRAAWEQLRVAAADRALLEAKLREALASQPAAIDPRELARAEERSRGLMKENDLLKNALDEEKSSPRASTSELDRLRRALSDTTRKLQTQNDAAVILLAENNTKLQRQIILANAITQERNLLQHRLDSIDTNSLSRITAENAELRGQLQSLTSAPAGDVALLTRQVQEAQLKLNATQSERDALALEKGMLEQRLAEAQKAVAKIPMSAATSATTDLKRITELERERDELQKKLNAANTELANRTSKAPPSNLRKLNDQILALRAKLDVYETKAVPYTREELAMFKMPDPTIALVDTKKGKGAPAASTAALSTQGERQSSPSQMVKAESTTSGAKVNDKDLRALWESASKQVENNQLEAAEQTIQKALAIDPNDPPSLGVLGYIRFSQTNYDEALELLSRAAKLKPQDANIQNLLGIALIQKGMRGQAETAFRKALQINPNHRDAHRNLANMYIMQNPPMIALARWHYQKALDAGHPRVPELESRLGLTEK